MPPCDGSINRNPGIGCRNQESRGSAMLCFDFRGLGRPQGRWAINLLIGLRGLGDISLLVRHITYTGCILLTTLFLLLSLICPL